eukprot:scaffold21121_cov45-Phaeocystis_antarctica.AAC.1
MVVEALLLTLPGAPQGRARASARPAAKRCAWQRCARPLTATRACVPAVQTRGATRCVWGERCAGGER